MMLRKRYAGIALVLAGLAVFAGAAVSEEAFPLCDPFGFGCVREDIPVIGPPIQDAANAVYIAITDLLGDDLPPGGGGEPPATDPTGNLAAALATIIANASTSLENLAAAGMAYVEGLTGSPQTAPAQLQAAAQDFMNQAGVVSTDNAWVRRRPLNISHRGGENDWPENTMFAYAESIRAAGSDMIEMDIYETADGELVVIHDDSVDRTTNGSGSVSGFTLAQLRALDAAHWFAQDGATRYGTDHGKPESHYIYRGIAAGAKPAPAGYSPEDFRIPTLREIFENPRFDNVFINIELKPDPDSTGQYEAKLAAMIREYGRGDDVIVASFLDHNSSLFKANAPEISTSVPTVQVAAAKATGNPPFAPAGSHPGNGITVGHQAFQVPVEFSGIPALDAEFVTDAHARGMAVHAWTINGRAQMVELLNLCVDGIMSDNPLLLEEVLRSNEWSCALDAQAPGETGLRHYIGSLHEHSGFSDGAIGKTPADYFQAGVDQGLAFVGSSEHSDNAMAPVTANTGCLSPAFASCVQAPPDGVQKWAATARIADEKNRPGDFTAIRGFEWTSDRFGHINVFFSKNDLNAKTASGYAVAMEDFWQWLALSPDLGGGADGIAVFNHPGREVEVHGPLTDAGAGGDPAYTWNDFEYRPEHDARVVGIEMYGKSGDYYDTDHGAPAGGWLAHALDKGWHVAPVGAEDEHGTSWAQPNRAKTVILAVQNTRAGLRAALAARRFYAVAHQHNDVRLHFAAGTEPMGSRLMRATGTVLAFHAEVSDENPANGVAAARIEVVGPGGTVVASGNGLALDFNATASAAEQWRFVRVLDASGKVLAVSAPIWFGADEVGSPPDSTGLPGELGTLQDVFDALSDAMNTFFGPDPHPTAPLDPLLAACHAAGVPDVLCARAEDVAGDGSLSRWVDPRIGSYPPGFTNPGPVAPYGMVALGPDTEGPLNYGGYYFHNTLVSGFSHVHMSAGVYKGGYFPVLPFTGERTAGDLEDVHQGADHPMPAYSSSFDHASEAADAGYYSVILSRYAVRAELTATERAGLHRYTFNDPQQAPRILIDVTRSLSGYHNGTARLRDGVLSGRVDAGFPVFFAARASAPFTATTFGGAALGARDVSLTPGNSGVILDFADAAQPVLLKVGISYTDEAGALANLDAEIPGWDFEATRAGTRAAWDDALAAIEVEGGSYADRVSFYSALYRAQHFPNLHSDVDGRYRGPDGAVHADTRPHYSQFSSWDSYRGQNQLQAEIVPERYADMVNSLLAFHRQAGYLPRWQEGPKDASHMSGDPIIPFIGEAWCRGALDADLRAALWPALQTLVNRRDSELAVRGYLSVGAPQPYATAPSPLNPANDAQKLLVEAEGGSGRAGTTLEYGIADFSLALMGQSVAGADANTIGERSLNYRNLLDPETRWIRPRHADGSWLTPFAPELGYGFQEGTSWQYSWLAMHDYAGVIAGMGGDAAVNQRLDIFFNLPADLAAPIVWPAVQNQATALGVAYYGNQYAPGNEHDLEAPFVYNYSGEPWKTQTVSRAAVSIYTPTITGLPGNDDLGALSGWLVWAMAGVYPINPGTPLMVIGSPVFEKVTIRRPSGDFVIEAPGASAFNRFVTSAEFNGQSLDQSWLILPRDATTVRLTTSPVPDRNWASAVAARPPSFSTHALSAFGCAAYEIAETDSDGDGVPDDVDACPSEGGPASNNGCPVITDTTPNAFSFTSVSGVSQSTVVSSNVVSISGIDAPSPISVAGGEYRINGGAYTSADGAISNGQTVQVRHISASAANTVTETTLTIGGVVGKFRSTTGGAGGDTDPDAFSFGSKTDQPLNTTVTSIVITPTGYDAGTVKAGAGTAYSIGCTSSFITTSSTITQGQSICVQHTTASSANTLRKTSLQIGKTVVYFSTRTAP